MPAAVARSAVALALLALFRPACSMCDSYCRNPCPQFAQPSDTVAECSDCTDDGTNKCFPGAHGYNGEDNPTPAAEEKPEETPATEQPATEEPAAGKVYEGIDTMPFSQLVDDKRMKMAVFHWGGEKGGDDLIKTMQTLKTDPNHADYLWFHVDVSADPGAQAEFKQDSLPMTFSQTPEDGIAHFNGGDFNEANFKTWHAFRMGEGWKDGNKVVRMEADDLPHKLVEMTQKGPVFIKMYEEWCHHCASLAPHWKRSSNEVPEIPFVEVECAKAGGFCNQFFPANGFPRVHMISKGGAKSHKYQGYTYQKITAFAKDPSTWELTHDTNLPGAAKAEL